MKYEVVFVILHYNSIESTKKCVEVHYGFEIFKDSRSCHSR